MELHENMEDLRIITWVMEITVVMTICRSYRNSA